MKYLLPLIILVLSFSVFGRKEKPCSAELLKADIGGLMIGASKDSISAIFSDPVWKTKDDGTEYLKQTDFQDKNKFAGIETLELEIYENELYKLTATYSIVSTINTDTDMESFAKGFSKSRKIPEKWKNLGVAMFIKCRERSVVLDLRNIMTMRNTSITEKIAAKEKSAKF